MATLFRSRERKPLKHIVRERKPWPSQTVWCRVGRPKGVFLGGNGSQPKSRVYVTGHYCLSAVVKIQHEIIHKYFILIHGHYVQVHLSAASVFSAEAHPIWPVSALYEYYAFMLFGPKNKRFRSNSRQQRRYTENGNMEECRQRREGKRKEKTTEAFRQTATAANHYFLLSRLRVSEFMY